MLKRFSILFLLAAFLSVGAISSFAQDRGYHRHTRIVVRTDIGRRHHHRFWRRHYYNRYPR